MDIHQARQLAEDETTAPNILADLAENKDFTTRQHIASNPNTPMEVLFILGIEFPEELLNNSIFDLLLLENPNFIEELSVATKCSLLKCEKVPHSLMEWGVKQKDEEILFILTINSATDCKTIKNLSNHKNYKIAEAAKLHINNNQQENREEERVLIESIRQSIFSSQQDINSRIQLGKLLRLKLVPLILIPLLPIELKMSVAQHGNNSFYIEKIVNDCLSTLEPQESIDQHKVKSYNFEAEGIIEAVAGNFHAPIFILIRLAKIYGSKTYNNSICEKAIYCICQYVSNDLNNRTHILEEFMDDRYINTWQYIARNILTPKKILLKLTTVSNPPYEDLAQNPNTPIVIGQNNSFILNIPSANYAQVQSSRSASKIMQNFGQSIIEKSIPFQENSTQSSQESIEILENIIKRSKRSFSLYRLIPFFHPQISSSLLSQNAGSICWWERYAIAQNPNTPYPIIQRLAKDGNCIVRAAAKAKL